MVTYALLWLCRVQYILVRPHTVLYNLDLYGPVLFHMFQIGLICSHRSVWSIKTDGVQDGLLGSQKFWFGPMWFGLEHCCLIWLHMVQYFPMQVLRNWSYKVINTFNMYHFCLPLFNSHKICTYLVLVLFRMQKSRHGRRLQRVYQVPGMNRTLNLDFILILLT